MDVAVLDAIEERAVSLAVYRRALPREVTEGLVGWARALPSYDEVVDPGAWDPALATAALEDVVVRTWLQTDLRRLLTRFAALSGSPQVRVALRAVQTDACRKFHVDFLHMRLITTYVGPGTEWLPLYAARREILAHPPDCSCDANRAIVRDRRSIRRALAGDVLLMKGERHGAGVGTVHRSPPIEGTGTTRLVLTLSSAADR